MTDRTQLLANVQASQAAREAVAFIADEYSDQPQRFWECLADQITARLPQPEPPPVDPRTLPMTDSEANRFEQETLNFGKYAGTEIGQAPIEYLLWLAEGDEFTRRLRRYVKYKMFGQRQEEESEE